MNDERKKKRKRRRWRGLAIFTTVMLLLGYLAIEHVLPYIIIGRQTRTENITPADYDLAFDHLTVLTRDSTLLDAYYIPSSQDTAYGTIIILHGIGACKEYMLNLGSRLSHLGINALVFDLRGHGKSTGDYLSYGFYEKYDVIDLVNHLETRYGPTKFGIWGASYGGAVALQTLAIEDRLKFGVIESTFSTMREIVLDYKARIAGIRWQWLSDWVLRRAAEIGEFDPDEVRPDEACKQITQPMLLTHGEADIHISVEYGKRNFHNLASEDKELYLVPNATHNDVWVVGGEAYSMKLESFVRRQLSIPQEVH